ncbi:histidine phosphatase family protein [Nonomuraea endophytica]|uniref:Broad specificity phosphatase PhoE n=1 Tax=Nonomuraea endophytica TaxID=714136 RepID=A0A7W8EKK0_9ACTN|nr:histidine phosphatase family protein [Nonomuraea endophytica]MBB5082676.1 broad specificity phosphatase PhoE [Nonomuraea endophytica]
MRTACFPAPEQADRASLAKAALLAGTADLARTASYAGPGTRPDESNDPELGEMLTAGQAGAAFVAPSVAALQTASAMGLAPIVVDALAEADHGRWGGLPYTRVAQDEPDALASWLADPGAAPHGGESLDRMTARVTGWLDETRARFDGRRGRPFLVICDSGAIRAALGHALGLPPLYAARFDLAPLSTTELAVTRGGWRVAHVNRDALEHRKVTS